LISGDSFAVDYKIVDPQAHGWPNYLAEHYSVTNLAEAGVSEYKIVKQLESVDTNLFDLVIVVHTSPYRVHIKEHPLHASSVLHKNCDLLYSDLEQSGHTHNTTVHAALDYFKYIFDIDYYNNMYEIMLDKIHSITNNEKTLHVTFFDNPQVSYPFKHFKNLSDVFQQCPGKINHLTAKGNDQVVEKITTWIDKT
jgi:hypothetical protein